MRFRENECRGCEKVFCCEKCRLKHEISVHDFKEDCGVCQYGYLSSKNLNESLLQHMKNTHWPLRCVLCKFTFPTIQDVLKAHKCQAVGYKEDSPKTPYRNPLEGLTVTSEASPILPETQYKETPILSLNLITSTPMQRNDNMMKKDFNKHSEIVTPVDHVQMSKPTTASDDSKPTQVTKRRVTFCEMSIAENAITNTPELDCEEVVPKQLRDHYSDGAEDPYTPKRVQPPIEKDDNQEPQLEFSTPGRSDKSIIYDEEPMEFTPARSSNFSMSGCTEETEEKSHDEFKQEIEEIMSKNQVLQKDQSETDIIDNEQDAVKDGTTIWMSALNLSEDLSDERQEADETSNSMAVISNQNSQEIPEDSSPKIISSTPPKVAHPTPILRKAVTKFNQAESSAFTPFIESKLLNSVLEENPQHIVNQDKEKPVSDNCNLEEDYPKNIVEPHNKNPTKDHFGEEEKENSINIIKGHQAMDHSVQKEANLKRMAKQDYNVQEETNSKSIMEENKENLTLDVSAKNKIIKMHPTPHPILKNRTVNTNFLVENEKSDTANNNSNPIEKNETNNEKGYVTVRRYRSHVNKRLLEEYNKNSTVNIDQNSREATFKVKEEEGNLTNDCSLIEQIVKMHPTPHPELKQGIVKQESLNNYNKISAADSDKNSEEVNAEAEEEKVNVTIHSPSKNKRLPMHPTPYPKLKQHNANTEYLTEINENDSPEVFKNSPERQVVKVQPTPIIKRTNIHMKFHIPAHLSSTPILNMHPQPKIVKKVLTRQIVLQQGETNFCETSTTEMVGQINRSESISEIDRDSNSMADHQESSVACEESKSNVWASMARMVKRVIQKTVSFSNDSFDLCRSDDDRLAIAGTSFKRHFSESDSPEMAMVQQTKRFKFTDIKCRPPIRDIPPLRPPGRMLALPSTTTGGAATFEIVKSVTTTHNVPERKVCVDKATQTDVFLMD